MSAAKVQHQSSKSNSMDKFTWKVLLRWATKSAPTPFPGTEADTGRNNTMARMYYITI